MQSEWLTLDLSMDLLLSFENELSLVVPQSLDFQRPKRFGQATCEFFTPFYEMNPGFFYDLFKPDFEYLVFVVETIEIKVVDR